MDKNAQDSNNGASDSQGEIYNMKVNFNEKMKEYSSKSDDVL